MGMCINMRIGKGIGMDIDTDNDDDKRMMMTMRNPEADYVGDDDPDDVDDDV